MDAHKLCMDLLHAETEDEVDGILARFRLLDDKDWRLYGDVGNNFSPISNQAADAAAALLEKIVNAIDAVLMGACFERGLDPEGSRAPQSMADAVRQFFHVREGRIGTLSAQEQTHLAQNIHLVAVGDRDRPSYLVIDRGEGQTPERFPDTLVSLIRENKMKIPFVQGKFNAGGTAILQFCGTRNYQLIVSRRNPAAPVRPGDKTAEQWGVTLVRRVLPTGGRRSSQYVYLAPGGKVPSFFAPPLHVLPGQSGPNRPPQPYEQPLEYGTVIKLYEYRWKARSTATTEARYELERNVLSPALPFRITETRQYKANYYATTLAGVWANIESGKDNEDSAKVELGFPASGVLALPGVGNLPYQLAVFKEDVKARHIPHGGFFTLNGQVQGGLPADFVTRRLKFDYLSSHLLVAVDCTAMNEQVREDFFMASRDRVRQNEVYDEIATRLTAELREHPGLRELNAQRRRKQLEKALADDKGTLEVLQDLINKDPALAGLFSGGDRLVTSTGPGESAPFVGRRFPTYFRISGEPRGGLVKGCPVNRTTRVEFETDAANDYFTRADSPGTTSTKPPDVFGGERLWNGRYVLRLRPPIGARPGDVISVEVAVSDVERETRGQPFVCCFQVSVEQAAKDENPKPPGPDRPTRKPHPNGKATPSLSMPHIEEVTREEWANQKPEPFNELTALRIRHADDGGFDFYVNVDNAFLLTELVRSRRSDDKPLIKYWFKIGLTLCALAMLQDVRKRDGVKVGASRPVSNGSVGVATEESEDLETLGQLSDRLARVIVPIIRHLHDTVPAPSA